MIEQEMVTAAFAPFDPDQSLLLTLVSGQVDDDMLEEIAAADYGEDKDGHLRELRHIRDVGIKPGVMLWEPREVLELIRWSEPDDPTWKPGATGKRGHWMRAFSCAALLTASAVVENEDLRAGWNSTLIQLIDSLGVLGPQLDNAACSLLACIIRNFDPDPDVEELAFFGVALLWLSLSKTPAISDDEIIKLSEWTVARELGRERDCRPGEPRWLLGTTFYDQQKESWKRLGERLKDSDCSGRSQSARHSVQLIGASLART